MLIFLEVNWQMMLLGINFYRGEDVEFKYEVLEFYLLFLKLTLDKRYELD